MQYKKGDKVILEKGEWGFPNNICQRVDAEGVIVSIKPEHSNIHKYCVQHAHGLTYTDNKTENKFHLIK